MESGGEGLVSPRRTLWKMPPPPTRSRGRVTALARGPASRPRGRGLPPSSPHVRPCFVPLADEGLWDVFVKDIPRSATSCTVSLDRLRLGVTYEFRVLAVNQVGYGEPSSPSTAVSGRGPPGEAPHRGGGGGGMPALWDGRGQRRAGRSLAGGPVRPLGTKTDHVTAPGRGCGGLKTGPWAQKVGAS